MPHFPLARMRTNPTRESSLALRHPPSPSRFPADRRPPPLPRRPPPLLAHRPRGQSTLTRRRWTIDIRRPSSSPSTEREGYNALRPPGVATASPPFAPPASYRRNGETSLPHQRPLSSRPKSHFYDADEIECCRWQSIQLFNLPLCAFLGGDRPCGFPESGTPSPRTGQTDRGGARTHASRKPGGAKTLAQAGKRAVHRGASVRELSGQLPPSPTRP